MENVATGAIRLSFESKQKVVVVPENEDRFVTTAKAAAQACQQVQNFKEWEEQFENFLGYINGWCQGRPTKVRACYAVVGDAGLTVVVCTPSDEYAFDFDDEVAEFDLSLFREFPLCRSEVVQFPNQDVLISQLSEGSLLVYGDGE